MGTLYLVGTPIGNLEDITLRAIRTLREVSLIAAEDTRVTGRLLAHFQIDTPLTSFHEHNKMLRLEQMLDHLDNADLALVSDAGMPGLSDPGFVLVRAAVERGFSVVPIPGPSAVVSALVISGLSTDSFVYLGFLPRKLEARHNLLKQSSHERRTLIAFEAPHRLLDTLKAIQQVLGDRSIAVCREMTKLHEQVLRGSPGELLTHFAQQAPRGEITLVIEGAGNGPIESWDEKTVVALIKERLATGDSPSSAARYIAELSGRPRRELYRLAVEQSRKD